MNCCDWDCVQGRNCPVRIANAELSKSSKLIRRVQAGNEPPPDIKAETYIEYDWHWDALVYIYGVTFAWVLLFSFVVGIFWGFL